MQRFYFDPPAAPAKPANKMRRLLVRCPSTSKLVETGQTIEEHLWEGTPQKSGKFVCPHCKRPHAWAKKDVVLAR